MLPKAARPFGTKISVVAKNGETQINGILQFIIKSGIIDHGDVKDSIKTVKFDNILAVIGKRQQLQPAELLRRINIDDFMSDISGLA